MIFTELNEFSHKQECIPGGCVPPAAVAVSAGVSTHTHTPPGTRDPLDKAPPRTRHPPGTEHAPDQAPPGTRFPRSGPPPGPVTPPDQAPPDQAPPPWTETLTHASENITLPRTSFAGGNNSQN